MVHVRLAMKYVKIVINCMYSNSTIYPMKIVMFLIKISVLSKLQTQILLLDMEQTRLEAHYIVVLLPTVPLEKIAGRLLLLLRTSIPDTIRYRYLLLNVLCYYVKIVTYGIQTDEPIVPSPITIHDRSYQIDRTKRRSYQTVQSKAPIIPRGRSSKSKLSKLMSGNPLTLKEL